MDRELHFMERLGLRLHLLICTGCRAWRRQMRWLRSVMRTRLTVDDDSEPSGEQRLSPEARVRIRAALEQAI